MSSAHRCPHFPQRGSEQLRLSDVCTIKQKDVKQNGFEVQRLHNDSMSRSEPGFTREMQIFSQRSPKE